MDKSLSQRIYVVFQVIKTLNQEKSKDMHKRANN